MKNFLFAVALAGPIILSSSCNNDELQRLQAQNDSLRSVATTGGVKIDEYFAAFNSIQENLNKIKEKEQIISVKTSNGKELDETSADQINNDILSIYELMQKNKQTINDLNAKLQKNGLKNKEMAKTIQLLTEQITSKDNEITDLKTQLSKLNLNVQQLESQMAEIDSTLREEQRLSEEKSEIISSQDEALNTVYYVVGSKKELINHNIVAKDGVFKGLKIGPGMDKDYFTKVDLRTCNTINLNVKKAQILSSHPSGSYKLVQQGKNIDKIEITDPIKFWENSKILVVVTD
ncbi:MAG: hypothetical protein IJ150_11095 [Bacteroidales bacterium]|nr:hypothetical protein [Bacteroidales bacterium]